MPERKRMYFNLDAERRIQFWVEKFDMPFAISWLWWAKEVVDIEATLKNTQYTAYLVNRFCIAAGDTHHFVTSRRRENEAVMRTGDVALQTLVKLHEAPNMIFSNFRAYTDLWEEENPDVLGGISCIMVTSGSMQGNNATKYRSSGDLKATYGEFKGAKHRTLHRAKKHKST